MWTLFVVGGSAAWAQISPGALSRAHSALEGVAKCTSCHSLAAKTLKCLDCHTEIQKRIAAGAGLHARSNKVAAASAECANCHAEHRGPGVTLIELDRKKFDHGERTGFPLQGRHRNLSCESCHTAARIAATARSEIKLKNLDHSFLGLRTECTACHKDPHQGQLGTNCTQCHTQDQWRPAANFNHSSTALPLTGMHQKLSCAQCHAATRSDTPATPAAKSAVRGSDSLIGTLRFKDLRFDGCRNCHADPHQGAFQQLRLSGECEGCHNTNGFRSNLPGKNFNHSLTPFRLEGRHASVSCKGCHAQANFQQPIPHAQCQDCHKDQHQGQFAAKVAGTAGKDCSTCHSVAGFKPTLFDERAHQATAFPLEGKHLQAECKQCHLRVGSDTVFRSGKLTCPACHADPHAGQFGGPPYSNQCEQCHTISGFKNSTFSLDRHSQTKFALIGRHAELECDSCHKVLPPATAAISADPVVDSAAIPEASRPNVTPEGNSAENARRQFHFNSTACSGCHRDPHELAPSSTWTCETCHQPLSWKALGAFQHDLTKFPLVGAHGGKQGKPVACISCHRPADAPAGLVSRNSPVLAPRDSTCDGCHRDMDPHGGQFNEPAGLSKDCASCHTPDGWNGQAFHHDQAKFALDVAHRAVACVNCHKQQQSLQGRQVRIYRNTPRECLNCH